MLARSLIHARAFSARMAASRLREMPITINSEVEHALVTGKPVVALETTIITHGMPFPDNLNTAQNVERIVRQNGAVPAHIAILDGNIHVGLNDEELKHLASIDSSEIRKCSRRDIAPLLATKGSGGTTVAGTMLICDLVGLRVFATGGIGGVHRGVEESWDVSADLRELGRTPVCVVCAGVKSILDIPKTIEYLETEGVTVGSLQSDAFPAFFSTDSGVKSPFTWDNETDVAAALHSNLKLGLNSGMMVACPNPAPVDTELIAKATRQAEAECIEKGIKGANVTPYMLKRVTELTDNQSLEANMALMGNNATVASRISVELSNMMKTYFVGPGKVLDLHTGVFVEDSDRATEPIAGEPVVVGGATVDMTAVPLDGHQMLMHTSNPGHITRQYGGVGRNVAETLSRLGRSPYFMTCVGNDATGVDVVRNCTDIGLRLPSDIVCEANTATFNAMLDFDGSLMTAVADMAAFDHISPQKIIDAKSHILSAPMVMFDGNLPCDSMEALMEILDDGQIPSWFEPTSVAKSTKIVDSGAVEHITFMSPNIDELVAISRSLSNLPVESDVDLVCEKHEEFMVHVQHVMEHMITEGADSDVEKHILVTRGGEGLVLASGKRSSDGVHVHYQYFPTMLQGEEHIISTTGAGDSLVGGMMWGLMEGLPMTECVSAGLHTARMSLMSEFPVSEELSSDFIRSEVERTKH
eukprot:TRINITY_DN9136_c0_g1_i1.p1 TRINITY_DN9136_c0_g1~~TRINITY_DN9136_c0_g1_i1.p1  ORF type:complete len:699 (-),score=259.87 TRINITY_DN9136_c0_g1_i1:1026-3122(-)